jgi:hypothetical protein
MTGSRFRAQLEARVNIPADAYLLIIGAMKCGTSSLFSYLAAHPAICPSITKEPEFFSQFQRHRLQRVRNYEDLWHFDPDTHRYALEASTGYSKYPQERDIPRRMHNYGINPKFIYLVRNPFDRILSQYRHFLFSIPKFDPSTPLTANELVDLSNYYVQLRQYQPYFPRENFLILDFDELKNAPQVCLGKVYGFLNIAGDNYAPVSYDVQNAAPSLPEVLAARNRLLQVVSHWLPRSVRHWGAGIVGRIMKEREFTDQERRQIHRQLADSMLRFQEEYGFDVSKWGWD